jgi:hypothetical protein
MALDAAWDDRGRYRVVRLQGEPSLGEMLGFIERMGAESRSWDTARLLVDLRGITSLRSFTEQFTLGEKVASLLSHLDKLASVVPLGRRTRNSERPAQAAGFNLRVFEDEDEAVRWLETD